MRLRKLQIFLFILLIPTYSSAQKALNFCTLTKKDAPVLRGVRLGMTPEEISKVLQIPIVLSKNTVYANDYEEIDPVTKKKKFVEGFVHVGEFTFDLGIYDEEIETNPNLKGLVKFEGGFFNNRLYTMTARYDEKFYNFESIKIFVSAASVLTKIPETMWEFTNIAGTTYSSFDCQDFLVVAHINVSPDGYPPDIRSHFSLTVTDRIVSNDIREKVKQAIKRKGKERLTKEEEVKEKKSKKIFKL